MSSMTSLKNFIIQMVFIEPEWLPPKRLMRQRSTDCLMRWIKSKGFWPERIISLEIGLQKRTLGSMSLSCVIHIISIPALTATYRFDSILYTSDTLNAIFALSATVILPFMRTHLFPPLPDANRDALFMSSWLRKLYWRNDAFTSTTDFNHIKTHYYWSHPFVRHYHRVTYCYTLMTSSQINPTRVVPAGPIPYIEPL